MKAGRAHGLLADPALIRTEIGKRLAQARTADPAARQRERLELALAQATTAITRMIEAFQEQLITIDELRGRMLALRARETNLRGQADALNAQLADREAYLKLADDLEGFLAQLRASAATGTIEERQRVLRLLVKDILIGPEKITIRHRIPTRERSSPGTRHASEPDTEGDHRPGYPLRWGRDLNTLLQEALTPHRDQTPERRYGGRVFRVGDKVTQLRNNYDKGKAGIFNGTVGVVTGLSLDEQALTVLTDEDEPVDYDFAELDELAHAYAVTIHRSQGSEYPAVVIPLTTASWMMLRRNLLYTGVTRARKLIVLAGSRRALAQAVRTPGAGRRHTALTHRLHPPGVGERTPAPGSE